MRLTTDRAKQAILYPEQHVRSAAVYYFARSFNQDKEVLSLAIQAIEQYGDGDAFQTYSFLEKLAHTEETLRRVVERLKTTQRPTLDDDFYGGLPRGLILSFVNADPELLQPYQNRIDQLDCLDDKDRRMVTERIRMVSVDPHELWRDLEEFCEQHKNDDDVSQADLDHAHRLVEALGRQRDLFGDKILELLALQIDDFENNPMTWLEMFAARIAGEMRLEPAVPLLAGKLHEDGDWLNEECLWALIKIGTDSVVEELFNEYVTASWGFRISAVSVLEDIHSDLVVKQCFDLLDVEDDHQLREHLYRALLVNGATAAIEPVRELLFAGERDPEWLELRSDLVTAATIMDVEFPELAEWKDDTQHDMELRKQWYAEQHQSLEVLARDDIGGDDFGTDDFEEDDDWPRPPNTLVASTKVGRNDPCPCGSGKKYKKCCLRKEKRSVLN